MGTLMDDKDSTPQNGMDTDVDAGNGNGSDEDTGNVDTPGMPLVDTVLSFVMHGLNSGTPDNVLKIALGTITVLEVQESVRKLWKNCNLGDLPVRNNTQRRTECSALLTDIIQKFQYLDEAGAVPYLCCDVIGLSRIPKFQNEDVTDIAMADRIRRLPNCRVHWTFDLTKTQPVRKIDQLKAVELAVLHPVSKLEIFRGNVVNLVRSRTREH